MRTVKLPVITVEVPEVVVGRLRANRYLKQSGWHGIKACGLVFTWPTNPFTTDGRLYSFGRDGGEQIYWGWF